MRLLRRRRAEPEPAIVINADADISPERLEALRRGLAAAMDGSGTPVSEPAPTVDRDPVTGKWVSRKRM